jgi:tetratricopeptide (TPR) repeat protein
MIVMRILSKIGISILVVFFLMVGASYGQDTAEEHYDRGVEYGAQGKFKEAKEEFEEALKVDPLYGPAKQNLKVVEDSIDQKIKREITINLFKIEINPRDADAYYNLGVVYDKKGWYNQAILNYTKAIEINPRDAVAYYNRGNAYGNKNRHNRAISDYTKAIKINPRDADAYNNRGNAYYRKRQHDYAILDFTKAIEINPGHATAYNNRGFVYLIKLMDKNRGCADWKRACELGDCYNYKFAKRKGNCE